MQSYVDKLKVMLDFAELVALPCGLPLAKSARLALALTRYTGGASPLADATVRTAIWEASQLDDIAVEDDLAHARALECAEHFRTTVLRRICCRDELLDAVTRDGRWLMDHLFMSANVASVLAALLQDHVSIGHSDDGDELGPLAVLITRGQCPCLALEVVNAGLNNLHVTDPDPLVATVMCDIIQHCLLGEILALDDDEGVPVATLADLLRDAAVGLKDSRVPVRVVASAALVKTVLYRVACAMKEDIPVPAVLTAALNRIFDDDHPVTQSCAIHLLTQLRYGRPSMPISCVADALQGDGTPPMFPRLATFRLCRDVDDSLPFDPLEADPTVLRVTDALALASARSDRVTAEGLLAALQETGGDDAIDVNSVHRAVLSLVLHRHVLQAASGGLTNNAERDRRVLNGIITNWRCAVARQVNAISQTLFVPYRFGLH